MRPTVLGSSGCAPPENEPAVVKLEDSDNDDDDEREDISWDPGPEAARLRFRCFRYEDAVGPQEALAQLRELCHQWLRPEVHSKEQVLELLVLEQFLGALPPEIQAHVQGQWPGSPEEAAALVDRLRWELDGPRKWVSQKLNRRSGLEHCHVLSHSRSAMHSQTCSLVIQNVSTYNGSFVRHLRTRTHSCIICHPQS